MKTMDKDKKLLYSSVMLPLFIFLFLFLLFNFLYHYDNKYTAGAPYGQDGVFSFQEKDLSKPLPLIDGWELYPDHLYTPSDFTENKITPSQYTFIGQYSNFSFIKREENSAPPSPFGSATYRLTLNYTGEPETLILEIPEIFTDYILWVDDKPVASTGGCGFVTITPDTSTQLLLSVTNTTHYYSGLTYPPVLGHATVMGRMFLMQDFFYGILFLFPLSLCLFAVVALFTKGYTPRFAHFGLLCLFFSLQTSYHFLYGMGASGIFSYALEDTARMAILYETVALCTLECDFSHKNWYRLFVRPIGILFCGFTAVTVVCIIPNADWFVNQYGRIVDVYRLLCFFYLCGCALYGLFRKKQGSPFILSACAAIGVSLYLNIIQNSRFEPLYTGWQMEYTTLVLVILFWCLMMQHIRELAETNQRLTNDLSTMVVQRTEELHAVLEERKTFFSNLAHDMKAPITSIHGFVNLILRGNLYVDDDLKEYLSLIGSQTSELGRRVQALSDLHSYDKISDPVARISINQLLKQVYKDNEPETCAMGILLKVTETSEDVYILGVWKKLLILFENLIYNAMSFTPEDGKITVSANLHIGEVVIEVADTGCGIATEHIPHIFNQFYSARENQKDGSGLGLYIAKITVEEIGGSIHVSSKLNEGTTFFVHFPLA